NYLQLTTRSGVLLELPTPDYGISGRQFHLALDLRSRIIDCAGQISTGHRILQTDVARVVLPVDERRTVVDLERGHLTKRNLRATRRRDENVADLVGCLAELWLQAHYEIVQLLSLHDLRRGRAADGGLDQP